MAKVNNTAEVKEANLVESVEDLVKEATKNPVIRKDIQAKVDKYVEMHALYKKMEARMKELREDIEPYMETKGLTRVSNSTDTGAVCLEDSQRAEMTARYTSYDPDDLLMHITEETEDVLVTKVDRDVLEHYVKMGKLPRHLLVENKITKTSTSFRVRRY